MANSTIQLKHSGTTSNVPSVLQYGELAINYADGLLYYKNVNNYIVSFSSGSPASNGFTTFNANGTLLVADLLSDVLYVNCGSFIEIVGDAVSDSLTITANIKPAYDRANAAYLLVGNAVISVNGTAGQIYSSGGNTPTINLISTGVAAGVYGGKSIVPVVNVDSYGRVVSATNVAIGMTIRTISANDTILATDNLILANSNSLTYLTLTMANALSVLGQSFRIKNINNGTVTMVTAGADMIDIGYANVRILFQNSMIGLISTGTGYVLF